MRWGVVTTYFSDFEELGTITLNQRHYIWDCGMFEVGLVGLNAALEIQAFCRPRRGDLIVFDLMDCL
jgi:hypothetical protein